MARERLEILAGNLSRLLVERGWSQNQLAKAVSIHRVYIGRIVRAQHTPSVFLVEDIADALGVSMKTLLQRPKSVAHRPMAHASA